MSDWISWIFYKSTSLIRITPFLINKLINIELNDNKRPALYSSSLYSGVDSFFSDCHHIIDNIYLGSSYNASDYNLLDKLSINNIVNVTDKVPNFFEDDLNFNYYYHEIKDNGIDIFEKEQLENIYEFIKKSENNVLVHCVVGRSRSATIVIYYLMKEHNMTVDESIKYLRSKREVVNPSLRLINSLKKIEEEIHKK